MKAEPTLVSKALAVKVVPPIPSVPHLLHHSTWRALLQALSQSLRLGVCQKESKCSKKFDQFWQNHKEVFSSKLPISPPTPSPCLDSSAACPFTKGFRHFRNDWECQKRSDQFSKTRQKLSFQSCQFPPTYSITLLGEQWTSECIYLQWANAL